MRIVGIGDSVMHGETMAAYGNEGWRDDTITSQLERRFVADDPSRQVAALNLGLNGAVPGDYERIVSLALTAKPALIVMNVSMRSFSADFNADAEFMSRDWLLDFEIEQDGSFIDTRYRDQPLSVEGRLTALLVNNWYTYRYRDVLQQLLLGGRPREAMTRLLKSIDATLTGEAPALPAGDDMLTLLKSKQRYASIRLDDTNRQLASLARAIERARKEGVPVVLVYGRENPSMIFDVIERPAYEKNLADFAVFVDRFRGEGFAYVPPIADIPVERYLDLVHVDSEAYAIYVDRIFDAAQPLLR
ncbi:MAG: hypothetical protein AB7V46_14930 [Thermomicrobiales bacterium]